MEGSKGVALEYCPNSGIKCWLFCQVLGVKACLVWTAGCLESNPLLVLLLKLADIAQQATRFNS